MPSPSVQDILRRRIQDQQADSALRDLQNSQRSGAPLRDAALAGLGAAQIPVVLSTLGWATHQAPGVVTSTHQKEVLRHFFKSRGMPENAIQQAVNASLTARANQAMPASIAEAIADTLPKVERWDVSNPSILKALSFGQTLDEQKDIFRGILNDARTKGQHSLDADGVEALLKKSLVAGPVDPRKVLPTGGADPNVIRTLFDEATALAKKDNVRVAKTDYARILARDAWGSLKRDIPSLALIALPIAAMAAAQTYKKRKRLQELAQGEKMAGAVDTATGVAPAAGAAVGAGIGYHYDDLFDPRALFPHIGDATHPRLRKGLSGLIGAGTVSGVASLPGAMVGAKRALVGTPKVASVVRGFDDELYRIMAARGISLELEKEAGLRGMLLSAFGRKAAPAVTTQAVQSAAPARLSRLIESGKASATAKSTASQVTAGKPPPVPATPKPPTAQTTVNPKAARDPADMTRGFKSYSELMREGKGSATAARMAAGAGGSRVFY